MSDTEIRTASLLTSKQSYKAFLPKNVNEIRVNQQTKLSKSTFMAELFVSKKYPVVRAICTHSR